MSGTEENSQDAMDAGSLSPLVKTEAGMLSGLDQLFPPNELDQDQDEKDVLKIDAKEEPRIDLIEAVGGNVEVKTDEAGQPMLARKTKLKTIKHEPILFPTDIFPSAREEAALAFQELENCTYQSKEYGETGQDEMMSCDCKPEIAPDGENFACGENSDCINRLTSIECTDDECNCGARCANQRFQLREYAGVDVFHAGKKGYGLRALVDLDKEMFVYEYVGEVIGEKRFRQRQKEYEEQGEKHFYFMMLQKGEYIDATKKGGFGRFINHSCEPNCYVDKWVVGSKLRMGIFTKKEIVKGEELTFDYNVDRYGGEATPCYCGEPTCLGYIGGKTQTEAANKLPQNVVEALGLDDDEDWDDAKPKSTRRRKKGQDDEEYVSELTPRSIAEKDVPKIMATLLQTTERWLLKKLLQRISNDANEKIQTKIIALHGYQTLGSKLEKWKEDTDISILILQILQKWPTFTKNKIASSKIETHVKALIDAPSTTVEVKQLSTGLLETWSTLEMAYRIPRRVRPIKADTIDEGEEAALKREEENQATTKQPSSGTSTPSHNPPATRKSRNPTYRQDQPWRRLEHAYRARETARPFVNSGTPQGARFSGSSHASQSSTPVKIDPINHDLQAIIDAATKKQQEQAAALKAQEERNAAEEAARLETEALKRAERARRHEEHKIEKEKRAAGKRKHHKETSKASTKDPASQLKSTKATSRGSNIDDEKRLERLFAKFVPNVIAKYQQTLGKEQFKKRAKEIVRVLVAKEMKSSTREVNELSDHKKSKVKAYSRAFMDKVVARQSSKANQSLPLAGQDPSADGEGAADSPIASPAASDLEEIIEEPEVAQNGEHIACESENASEHLDVEIPGGCESPDEQATASIHTNGSTSLKRSVDEEVSGVEHQAKRIK